MKAILIARVSTEEQKEAGNSLPAQISRLEQYCRNNGFSILCTCSLYRGLIRCGDCSLARTHERQKGHVYYHCTQAKGKHGATWFREETITSPKKKL